MCSPNFHFPVCEKAKTVRNGGVKSKFVKNSYGNKGANNEQVKHTIISKLIIVDIRALPVCYVSGHARWFADWSS